VETGCPLCSRAREGVFICENLAAVAFYDGYPVSRGHSLVVPRRHVTSLLDLGPDDDGLVGAMVRKARDLARELGLGDRGFRLVLNCGDDAGYSVYHIHLHLLGGRGLRWPPG